jgi:TPR repeat protein
LIGAQYNLAVLLENGFGAPRDPTEARSLMQALASIGNADAKQWLASH